MEVNFSQHVPHLEGVCVVKLRLTQILGSVVITVTTIIMFIEVMRYHNSCMIISGSQ